MCMITKISPAACGYVATKLQKIFGTEIFFKIFAKILVNEWRNTRMRRSIRVYYAGCRRRGGDKFVAGKRASNLADLHLKISQNIEIKIMKTGRLYRR